MGAEAIPALLVRSEPPVVLSIGSVATRPFAITVSDPDGGSVDVSLSVGRCGATASSSGNEAIGRVLMLSQLCHRG